MNGHHLILGKLTDFLSGNQIDDTHDERYRQQIARMLVEEKGFMKSDIHSKVPLKLDIGTKKALVYVDFVVYIDNLPGMIIVYGPGSIVTRERPGLAISRLTARHQIAVVVVTNGVEAVVLDGHSGAKRAGGFKAIPSQSELGTIVSRDHPGKTISARQVEMESRILYAFEIDGRCPCDDTVCILSPE